MASVSGIRATLSGLLFNFMPDEKAGPPEIFAADLLFRVLKVRWLAFSGAIAIGLVGSAIGVFPAWCQKQFVDTLSNYPPGSSTLLLLTLVLMAFIASLAFQILSTLCRLLCFRESVIAQARLSRALYRHSLLLEPKEQGTKTVGQTVALFASDIQSVCFLVEDTIPNLIVSLFPLVIAPIAVSWMTNIPVWPPFFVTGLIVCACMALAWRHSYFFADGKVSAEIRLSLANEWLQNIRALRVLGWTESFEARMKQARIKETKNRLDMVTNGSTMNAIMQAAPLMINVAGVLSLLWYNSSSPSPGDVLSVLWLFGVFLARPLRVLPWCLVMFLDGYGSALRLERYFAMPIREPQNAESKIDSDEVNTTDTGPSLEVRGLLLKDKDGNPLLDIDHLYIPGGSLTAIVGEVGSGKTLLLQSLLGETWGSFDSYRIDGREVKDLSPSTLKGYFVYVPQDPFVISANLRDNVLFTYGSDATSDCSVFESLELAQLSPGAEELPMSLDTDIGERGVNLSGGQRQRVSLARAHAHSRPIILMDDALSAVDVTTEARIRNDLFLMEWQNRTRLLATHRLSILPWCDLIVFISAGKILEVGSFKELLERSPTFRDFVQTTKQGDEEAP